MASRYSTNRAVMRQSGNKNIGNKVEILRWSDAMDLLAIGNDKGEVIVHRLKWQKVWQHPPPEEGLKVRGIAWQPLEKIIAIGYSNGAILLLNIENKEEIFSINYEHDITFMNWTENTIDLTSSGTSYDDNHSTFLPPLPNLNSLSSTNKPSDHSPYLLSKKIFQLLIFGTVDGTVHLSVFGILPCCILNVFELQQIKPDTARIRDAKMSQDFKLLFVMIERESSLEMLVCGNEILYKYSHSLLNLAVKHTHILHTMCYIHDTIECIVEAWETVLLEMDNKLTKYANSQPHGSISADFLELMMFGTASPELEQFLLRDLTEKGLKKLGKSIELSYSTIQKLVVKPLHSAIFAVFYHLNSLQGMIQNTFYYEPLLKSTANTSLQNCGAFLIKAYELQQTIDTATRDFKIFFRWLYIVIVRLMDESLPEDNPSITQQEINYLAEFLNSFDSNETESGVSTVPESKKKFNLERVGQYLEEKPLAHPPTTDQANQWKQLLEQNDCLRSCPLIFPHHENLSLLQQHNLLKKSIDSIFQQPALAISADFSVNSKLSTQIPSDRNAFVPAFSHINLSRETSLVAILESEQSLIFAECSDCVQKTVRLRFDGSSPFEQKFANIGTLSFRHIQFYNDETLSVLLKGRTESGKCSSYFLQLTLSTIRETMDGITIATSDTFLTSEGGCSIVNAYTLIEDGTLKLLDGLDGCMLAVSGKRNVSAVVSDSLKTVRIYEMDGQEEDDEVSNTSQDYSTLLEADKSSSTV